MQLFILLFAAGILGYWLAKSRYHQTIDQAAGKAVETSKSWTENVMHWFQGSFSSKKETSESIPTSSQSPEIEPEGDTEKDNLSGQPARRGSRQLLTWIDPSGRCSLPVLPARLGRDRTREVKLLR